MLSCKEVARLASESQDRSLRFGERLSMRLHLLLCNMCSRYVNQLKFLKQACAGAAEQQSGSQAGLTENARQRIRKRLTKTK